jgi:hypothetical protein
MRTRLADVPWLENRCLQPRPCKILTKNVSIYGVFGYSLNVQTELLSHSLQIDTRTAGYLAFSPNSAIFRNLFFQNEA